MSKEILSGGTWASAVLSVLVSSCTNGASLDRELGQAVLVPEVTVGAPVTKSVVGGATLAENGRTYGMFLCRSDDYGHGVWGTELYNNVRAVYSGGWRYAYASAPAKTFSPMNIVTDNVAETFDLFCYSPWRSDAVVDGSLAYDLSSVQEKDCEDLMYATYEDSEGNPANLSIAVTDGAKLTVPVQFHHALARIVIHLKMAVAQTSGRDSTSSMRLCKIGIVRPQGSATPLYTRGEMELLTGTVAPAQAESDSLQTVTCDTEVSSASSWTSTSVLVHPQEYAGDGDFLLRLYFNGTDAAHALGTDYPIRRSDLMHPDGVTCGFRPGYSYHLRFVLQDYVHFEGAGVSCDWADGGEVGIGI